MLNANAVEAQEKGTNLKSCLGCKVVGYCSKVSGSLGPFFNIFDDFFEY